MKTSILAVLLLCSPVFAGAELDLGASVAAGLSFAKDFKEPPLKFAPVWDAKKKRMVCRNAKGEEGRNRMTAEELLATKQGACSRIWAGTDLMMKDLAGADLRLADLTAAWLQETNLRGADLRGARLWAAEMGGATLEGAKYDGATLFPSNMSSELAERRGMVRAD